VLAPIGFTGPNISQKTISVEVNYKQFVSVDHFPEIFVYKNRVAKKRLR